jgi:hypothetical protein
MSSTPLSRVLPVARQEDPILATLALQAATIDEPLKHKPGRPSGARHWRAADATPAPSAKRRVIVFN